MSRLYNILFVSIFSLTILCSCNQDYEIENGGGTEILVPSEGYIYFDSSLPKTRAMVPTGPLKAPFKIIGYRYPSSWAAIKPQAKQTLRVSYTNNEGVAVDGTDATKDNLVGVFGIKHEEVKDYSRSVPGVQTVDYKDGAHSYGPIQSWQKRLYYSFFAWYPTTLVANCDNNGIYNSNYIGSPYITYELLDKGEMVDVLTACEIDYHKGKGMSVPLQMNHRLSALDIRANSVITAQALIENKYPEFEGISLSSPVTVIVNKISLTLDKIYTQARIPLDHTDASVTIVPSGQKVKTYTYENLENVEYNITNSLVSDEEMLILIPQPKSNPIQASIEVEYSLFCEGKTKTNFTAEKEFSISDLESGVFHYIELTFTKTGLFVKADKAVTWEIQPNVEHTFE